MTDKDFKITKDAKYSIKCIDAEDMEAVFRGYSMIGSDTSLVLELGSGRVRFLPVSQIIYLDLIEDAPQVADVTKKCDGIYYG